MMRLLLCLLLWSLANSQAEFPYVSFRGVTLPNHGYVDLSLVGSAEDGGDSVQCHTDLNTCCTSGLVNDDPYWYFPNGFRNGVGFMSGGGDIYQHRGAQRIDLCRRNNVLSPSGIYRCEIPTDDGDGGFARETVYVGIYGSGGTLHIEVDITFTVVSDLNGTSPQFTLTCVSTGGPATTVTWTRDYDTVTEGTETVLDDPVTAQYTHTLTVTGRLGGLYTCTVANNKPSSDSAGYNVLVLRVNVDTITATSIFLFWSISTNSEGVSYEVMWHRDTSIGCPYVLDEDSTTISSTSHYAIEGLEEYSRYIITVTAYYSDSEDSNTVTATTLEAAPSAPPDSVSVSEVTSSSITVQWEMVPCIHRNGDITGYSLQYTGGESTQTMSVSGSDVTEATITGLTPSTTYFIRMAAVNDVGTGPYSSTVDQLTAVEAPFLSPGTTTATSISLSWTSGGSEGVSYEVMWQRDTSLECPDDEDEGSDTISSTSYDIMRLEEDSRYSITVTALNKASSAASEPVTAVTLEAAPSGPPTAVRATSTSTTITVQWEPVRCIHRNGDTTGYSMQYGKESAEGDRIVEMVSGNETTITGLMPSTLYSIQVAAVNSVGTGVYSDVLRIPTRSVYLSLNGDIIPNHGYVVISDIGSTDDTALICHTNHPATYESYYNYNSGGNWLAPDLTRVNRNDVPGFMRNRGPMVVRLRRSNSYNPLAEGIYLCEVKDTTEIWQTIYVGLYNRGNGNIMVYDDLTMAVDSDFNGACPQFTLTCISTGGSATTVTWTRDSVPVNEGTETVLNDPVTAQYTHTLTVTERLGGLYTCTVANNKPSSDSASYKVLGAEPPNDILAIQASGTSILVSWRPSGDAIGYIISYTGAGRSASVTVDGGSTDNHTLTGLRNGATYTISIVTISQHFSSEAVAIVIYLGQLSVSVTSVTATSISLSWSVPSDSVVTSYEVMWREGATEMTSGSLTDTSYTIQQLESNANYTIIVIATNIAGSTESLPIIFLTGSDYTRAIIGGVAGLSFTMAVAVTILVIVIACRRATTAQKSSEDTSSTTDEVLDQSKPSEEIDCDVIPTSTDEALDHSKPSEKEEEKYVDSDVIPTSTNEAYHTVRHPRETVAAYAIVNIPRTVPSHS